MKKILLILSLALILSFTACSKSEPNAPITVSESRFFEDTNISWEEYTEKYQEIEKESEYLDRVSQSASISFEKESDTAELDEFWRTASENDNLYLNIDCEGLIPDKKLYAFIDGNIDSPVIEENVDSNYHGGVLLKGVNASVGTHTIQFVQFEDESWEPAYCVSSEYYITE